MINKDFTPVKKEFPQRDPVPMGIYQVQLLDVDVDPKPSWDNKSILEDYFTFKFVLLSGADADNVSLRGRTLFRNYVPTSLFISKSRGKNLLYRILEALLGREINPEEADSLINPTFINNLIGKQCTVVVEVKKKTDSSGIKNFSNIINFLPSQSTAENLPVEELNSIRIKLTKNPNQIQSQAQSQSNSLQSENPLKKPVDSKKVNDEIGLQKTLYGDFGSPETSSNPYYDGFDDSQIPF